MASTTFLLDPTRTSQFRPTDYHGVASVVENLERAWNHADARAFAEEFTVDADFVNVYGTHGAGRDAIARGHDAIFRSVYLDSIVRYQLAKVRFLADDIAIVHLKQHLRVPRGHMAGDHAAAPIAVMVRQAGEWKISALQNTWVAEQPQLATPVSYSRGSGFSS